MRSRQRHVHEYTHGCMRAYTRARIDTIIYIAICMYTYKAIHIDKEMNTLFYITRVCTQALYMKIDYTHA